jgi:CRP-like cAMP-binding protein
MEEQLVKCSQCTIGSCALHALKDEEVLEMEEHAHHSQFSRGEILLRQDTPFHSIIYLRSGLVKEYMIHRSSPDQIIQLIKPRSYIGLQSLFTANTSVFSYKAIIDSEVCFIERETFNELIRGNGNFAQEIMVSLSKESLSNQQRILGLNQKQIYGKVAEMLLYLSEQVFDNQAFDLQLTRTELAQMVASTRESVTKTLIWFDREGLIAMNKNQIRILDKKKIMEIARRG